MADCRSDRLGDRDWVSMDELRLPLTMADGAATIDGLQKIAAGIAKYREMNGSIPVAPDITRLDGYLASPLYQ